MLVIDAAIAWEEGLISIWEEGLISIAIRRDYFNYDRGRWMIEGGLDYICNGMGGGAHFNMGGRAYLNFNREGSSQLR